jgi:aminoglycoside phosphotransferase (APT) family kinase protein
MTAALRGHHPDSVVERVTIDMRDDAPASVHALTIEDLVEGVWKPFIRSLTAPDASQTLLHGDPHIGNTYLLADGDLGFLDWQVARRGNFSLDLGYFLQGALTTDDRRIAERQLLQEYRDALGLPARRTRPLTTARPAAMTSWPGVPSASTTLWAWNSGWGKQR